MTTSVFLSVCFTLQLAFYPRYAVERGSKMY